jgi:hypothetical protein
MMMCCGVVSSHRYYGTISDPALKTIRTYLISGPGEAYSSSYDLSGCKSSSITKLQLIVAPGTKKNGRHPFLVSV